MRHITDPIDLVFTLARRTIVLALQDGPQDNREKKAGVFGIFIQNVISRTRIFYNADRAIDHFIEGNQFSLLIKAIQYMAKQIANKTSNTKTIAMLTNELMGIQRILSRQILLMANPSINRNMLSGDFISNEDIFFTRFNSMIEANSGTMLSRLSTPKAMTLSTAALDWDEEISRIELALEASNFSTDINVCNSKPVLAERIKLLHQVHQLNNIFGHLSDLFELTRWTFILVKCIDFTELVEKIKTFNAQVKNVKRLETWKHEFDSNIESIIGPMAW